MPSSSSRPSASSSTNSAVSLPASSVSRHQTYSNPSRKRASVVLSEDYAAAGSSTSYSSSASATASHSCCQTVTSAVASSSRSQQPATQTSRRSSPPRALKKAASVKKAKAAVAVVVQTAAIGSVGAADPSEYRMLFEDEYRDEATAYMHVMEKSTLPQVDLMDMQPELQWYMRPFLTEFLIEIHQQFRLRPEVLYLAMNIVDRYVSKRVVFKKHYQLVGCAALWIAAKFEDSKDKVPTVEMLRDMCCNAYDESAFIQMEGHVLSTINWCLGHPTAESWLRLACMGTSVEDAETQHVARFVMELSLFHKEFVGFLPSSIAAGALMLARFLLRKSRREIDEQDPSVEVAFLLDTHLGERLEHVSEIVVGKYSHAYYARSSAFVREQYLKGRRFEIRVPVVAPLLSPALSAISSSSSVPSLIDDTWSRSSSSSSIISDLSPRRSSSAYSFESDMPETPTCAFADAAEPFVVLPDSQPPPAAMSLAVPAIGKEARPREKTVVPAVRAGYVVQEPRAVFQSIQQQASGVYQPAPSVAVRRYSG